jgi:hypothetical protein
MPVDNRLHFFKQADVYLVVAGYAAVVFQGFGTGGLWVVRHKGHTADLQPFRCGKEMHVHRVMVDGINQGSFFKYQVIEAVLFCFQGTGNADRPAANNDNGIVLQE